MHISNSRCRRVLTLILCVMLMPAMVWADLFPFEILPASAPEASSVTVTIDADLAGTSSDASAVSGSGNIDLQNVTAPFAVAHITELELILDDGMDFRLAAGLVNAVAAPGTASVELFDPGPAATVMDGRFTQVGNFFRFNGEIDLSIQPEPFDLSEAPAVEADLTDVMLTREGNQIIAETSVDLVFEAEVPNVPVIGRLPISISVLGSIRGVIVVASGDYDGNQVLDANDIDVLGGAIRQGSQDATFDLNGDRIVDEGDHRYWVVELKNTYFGDANLDGEFNSSDFVSVFKAGQYEDGVPLNSGWATGDWNADGDFNSGDFVAAFQAEAFEVGPRRASHVVPEPSCWAVAAGVLLALFSRHSLDGRRGLAQCTTLRHYQAAELVEGDLGRFFIRATIRSSTDAVTFFCQLPLSYSDLSEIVKPQSVGEAVFHCLNFNSDS